MTRIEHAIHKAERGDTGAHRFLAKNLPSPATVLPPTISTAQQAAPKPTAPHPTATLSAKEPIVQSKSSIPRPIATPSTNAQAAPRPDAFKDSLSDRVQCRIYGGKAALCIESDQTRQNEPTLRIEAARATAPRVYDWKQKITLQLTREELPVVTAVILGLILQCQYQNHGPDHDKGLEIVHQDTHLFVRLFQKGLGVLAIPVTAADSYALGALCLRQLNQTSPWLSAQEVIVLLKLTVQRMLHSSPSPT